MMGMLSRSSGSNVGEKVLKPSEVRALRKAKNQRSSMSEAENGAQGVLRQIAAMRAQLGGETMSKKSVAQSEKALLDVCDELLSTEGNYLRDVKLTVEEYLMPLQSIVPAKLHGDVFANLQQLLGMHELLDADLKPARDAPTREEKAEKIAGAFKKFIPFFKMYANYSHGYATAPENLVELRQAHPKARGVLEAAEGESGPFLAALLFRPVQRMCVYPLLFKQALKHVEEGSPLHKQLMDVFVAIESTIIQVNDSVRKQAELARTADILLSEVGGEVAELLTPSRTLALEVDVDMKLAAGGGLLVNPEWKIRRSYHWYLLTDVLLVCRPKTLSLKEGRFAKKLLVSLSDVSVVTADGANVEIEPTPSTASFPLKPTPAAAAPPPMVAQSFPVSGSKANLNAGRRSLVSSARNMIGLGKPMRETSVTAPKDEEEVDDEDEEEDDGGGELDISDRAGAFHHVRISKAVDHEDRTSSAPVKGFRAGKEKVEAADKVDKVDKVEVLRLRVRQEGGHETDYKCWCASEGSKQHLISRIYGLQRELEHALNRGGGAPKSP
jgi:hypothetical protein